MIVIKLYHNLLLESDETKEKVLKVLDNSITYCYLIFIKIKYKYVTILLR